jgi:hypothetical protein
VGLQWFFKICNSALNEKCAELFMSDRGKLSKSLRHPVIKSISFQCVSEVCDEVTAS